MCGLSRRASKQKLARAPWVTLYRGISNTQILWSGEKFRTHQILHYRRLPGDAAVYNCRPGLKPRNPGTKQHKWRRTFSSCVVVVCFNSSLFLACWGWERVIAVSDSWLSCCLYTDISACEMWYPVEPCAADESPASCVTTETREQAELCVTKLQHFLWKCEINVLFSHFLKHIDAFLSCHPPCMFCVTTLGTSH